MSPASDRAEPEHITGAGPRPPGRDSPAADPVQRSITGFTERFGGRPDGVWSAPGRVNLIGEHTDYNGGYALPFAIDRRAAVAVGLRTDDRVEVASSAFADGCGMALAGIAPGSVEGWFAYPLGVAWALASLAGPVRLQGVDVFIDSDVPTGSGLSSSASLACALAVALNELWEIGVSRPQLGLAVQRAENQVVGAPTGIMDQFASLLAEPDCALLIDCADCSTERVPLGLAGVGLSIVVIDTREQHSHGADGYAERRAACEAAARLLGVGSLRELGVSDLGWAAAQLDHRLLSRVRHVVTENDRVLATVRALSRSGPAAIGRLLDHSHRSMRYDYEISTPALDLAVAAAREAGALGARMTGGGFGGSAIALVRDEDLAAVGDAAADALVHAGFPTPSIFRVTPGPGARRDR